MTNGSSIEISMKRIVFICLGNICRSPMAEFVFKKLAADCGREKDFEVCSRATSDEEAGNPVYPYAEAELKKHGISCRGKYAVQLKKSDYAAADLFVCMDDGNVRSATRIFGGDPLGKIVKLPSFYGSDEDIADPWYTRRFDVAYEQIEKGCLAMLEAL